MRRLEHQDAEHKTDEVLAEEARQHLAASPALQLVAELLQRLRTMSPPWWTPEALRTRFAAADRMRWLAPRADLRQRITSKLTGLAPKAARKKAPEFQGGLLDSVIDEGDATVRDLEEAFAPEDLAVYGPAEAYWSAFLELVPMDGGARESEELSAWLVEALLATASGLAGGFARKPILAPLDLRTAIDGVVWQTKVPLDVRVAIDRARLAAERERPDKPYTAADELAFATPAVLGSSLSLRELAPVLAAAEKAMGFASRPGASPAATSVSIPDPATVPASSPVAPSIPAAAAVAAAAASAASAAAAASAATAAMPPPPAATPSRPPAGSPSGPPAPRSVSAPPHPSGRGVPAPPPTMPSAPPAAGSNPPRSGPHPMHPPPSARGGPPTTPPGSLPPPPPMQGRASAAPAGLPPPPPHPVGPSGTMPPGPPSSPAPAASRRAPAPPAPAAPPPPPAPAASAGAGEQDEFDEVLETELESTNPWDVEGGGPDGAPPGLVSRGRPLRGR